MCINNDLSFKMIIISLLFIYSIKAIINPHKPAAISDFINCLAELIEYNFIESGDIYFVSTDYDSILLSRIKSELLKKICGNLRYKIELVTSTKGELVCERHTDKHHVLKLKQQEAIPSARFYLIFIENYKDFYYIFKKIYCSNKWNPNARFIILIFDLINKDNLEKIFTFLFQYNVLKVAIVVPQVKKNTNLIVYRWKPFDPPNYCGYFNETAENRLLVKNICNHGILKIRKDLLNYNIPYDMKGCVLNILAIEKHPFVSENKSDPNSEINFINKMLRQFNFKVNNQIIHSHRGERENNGKWSGALRSLVSKQGQLLLGGIFPDYNVHQEFQCSTTYFTDSYTWVVPQAAKMPRWRALINIFNESVWYFIIGGFIISIISWRILGKLSNDSAYNQDLNHCILNVWITAVGFTNYARPIKNSLRVFCVFFYINCLLLLTAYQTKLIFVLQNPTFEYQIKTTKELVTSGLKFGGFKQLHDLFINSSDPIDHHLGEQWIDVRDMRKALIDVAIHKFFSVLCSRMELGHFSIFMPELRNKYGYNMYYAFENNVFTVPIEIIALKGFAFMPNFSKILSYFKQNGIGVIEKRRLLRFNMKYQAKLRQKESNVRPLSLTDLKEAFLVLAVGYISGIIILCIEIFIKVYQNS